MLLIEAILCQRKSHYISTAIAGAASCKFSLQHGATANGRTCVQSWLNSNECLTCAELLRGQKCDEYFDNDDNVDERSVDAHDSNTDEAAGLDEVLRMPVLRMMGTTTSVAMNILLNITFISENKSHCTRRVATTTAMLAMLRLVQISILKTLKRQWGTTLFPCTKLIGRAL